MPGWWRRRSCAGNTQNNNNNASSSSVYPQQQVPRRRKHAFTAVTMQLPAAAAVVQQLTAAAAAGDPYTSRKNESLTKNHKVDSFNDIRHWSEAVVMQLNDHHESGNSNMAAVTAARGSHVVVVSEDGGETQGLLSAPPAAGVENIDADFNDALYTDDVRSLFANRS